MNRYQLDQTEHRLNIIDEHGNTVRSWPTVAITHSDTPLHSTPIDGTVAYKARGAHLRPTPNRTVSILWNTGSASSNRSTVAEFQEQPHFAETAIIDTATRQLIRIGVSIIHANTTPEQLATLIDRIRRQPSALHYKNP